MPRPNVGIKHSFSARSKRFLFLRNILTFSRTTTFTDLKNIFICGKIKILLFSFPTHGTITVVSNRAPTLENPALKLGGIPFLRFNHTLLGLCTNFRGCWSDSCSKPVVVGILPVSYTHLTLPTNREV